MSDFIRLFDGSTEMATQLKKIKLVATIKKVECLIDVIPLYLKGHALFGQDELNDASHGDSDGIEKAMLAAFDQSRFATDRDSGRVRRLKKKSSEEIQ